MSKVRSKWFHPEYCSSISITLLMTMETRAMKSELLCRHAITKWVAIVQAATYGRDTLVQPLAVIHEAWVITR
jgi:hypothetical protein